METFVRYKFRRKVSEVRYTQLNMMIQMKFFQGPRYIDALLERIHLMKNFLILELEQGHEVIIPRELSQDRLPTSFRYYDFILRFIQENSSPQLSFFQRMKNKLSKSFDKKLSVAATIGLKAFLGQDDDNQNKIIKMRVDDDET